MRTRKRTIIGVDLGQTDDPTALSVVEEIETTHEPTTEALNTWLREGMEGPRPKETKELRFNVVWLQRWKEIPYTQVVREVQRVKERVPSKSQLVIDATGAGLPVYDMMREAALQPVAIWFTAGGTVTPRPGGFNVPKRDLAATLLVLAEKEQIKIAAELGEARTLWQELKTFRVKIDTRTGHDTYEHWRERDGDDLLFSVAIAVWYARRVRVPDWSAAKPFSRGF